MPFTTLITRTELRYPWASTAVFCAVVGESACETLVDALEYAALLVLIPLIMHTAWISNSYALTIEGGVGKSINSDAADEEKPPELQLPAVGDEGSRE